MEERMFNSIFTVFMVGCSGSKGTALDDLPADSGAADSDTSAPEDTADSGSPGDSGTGDSADSGATCVPLALLDRVAPTSLSATGLYADPVAESLDPCVQEYEPQYALWADGATKRRFVYLPPGTQIDTSDMDHWSMPVGAMFWKEFSVAGVRVETRLIWRHGTGAADFGYATYQWNADFTDALYVANGVTDANGTSHEIPSITDCQQCHDQLPERILGFGAIQLSHAGAGVNIASLSASNALSVAAPDGFPIPGDAAAVAALGYLHANCGGCHNPDGVAEFHNAPFDLRLLVTETTVETTGTYTTAVGVEVSKTHIPGVDYRIAPGDAAGSAVPHRMGLRGEHDAMPPLASDDVDTAGLADVNAWISGL